MTDSQESSAAPGHLAGGDTEDGVSEKHVPFTTFFESIANCYEPLARYSAAALDAFIRDLLPQIPVTGSLTILDVGAGTGFPSQRLLSLLRGASLTLLDRASTMLSVVQTRFDDTIWRVCGDAQLLPFRDDSFSLLTSYCALHCFGKQQVFVDEAKRVLRTNGIVALAFNDKTELKRQLVHELFPGFHLKDISRQCSVEDVIGWLSADNFEIVNTGQKDWVQTFPSVEEYLLFIASKPFSGFALFSEDEFEGAFKEFSDSVRSRFGGLCVHNHGQLSWVFGRNTE